MRSKASLLLLVLLLAATMVACGGRADANNGNGGNNPPPDGGSNAQAGPYVYVANGGSGDISVFQLNPSTGALTAVAGSPFAAGASPRELAVTGSNRLVSVNSATLPAGSSEQNIRVWDVNPASGAPTQVAGATVAAGLSHLAVARGGNTLYAASNDAMLHGYAVGASAITPVPGSPYGAAAFSGTGISDLAADIFDERFLFAALTTAGGSGVAALGRVEHGALAATAPPLSLRGAAPALAPHPSGRFVFTHDVSSLALAVLAVDRATGALSIASTTPYGGSAASEIQVDPSGRYLFVADAVAGNVAVFSIDANTGALAAVAGSPFVTGAAPVSVAITPGLGYVLVANSASSNVSVFHFDANTGALVPAAGSPVPVGASPQSLVVIRTAP